MQPGKFMGFLSFQHPLIPREWPAEAAPTAPTFYPYFHRGRWQAGDGAELSIIEYNWPGVVNFGPKTPRKAAAPAN
jgi:hypothetical protein